MLLVPHYSKFVINMNIHFYLSDKGRETTSIVLVISHSGKYYRKATGMTCKTATWSAAKEKSGHAPTDKRLNEIRASLLSDLDELSTPQDIKKAIDKAFGVKVKEVAPKIVRRDTPTFFEYIKEWSERESTSKRQRVLAYNNIRRLMPTTDWADVTEVWYYRIIGKMEDAGWGINYQGSTIKFIKVIMHEALKLGYHSNRAYEEFRIPHAPVDNIYLTEEEMNRLWLAEPKQSMQQKARDLAWLGYLTCARFSDYSRLTEENIGTDGKIRFAQQKTSRAVVIPCAPRVREILSRNGGRAPVLSQQKFNDAIKELCQDCGICDKCETVSIKGRKRIHKVWEKWELVTSHTFRRSAATNLYLQGIPLRSIQQLTGHSSLESLERYLRVSGEENADRLSGIDFFTK